jgi:hypothetical protein
MREKSTMGTTTNNDVEQAFVKPVITQWNDKLFASDWPHS